MKVLLTILLIQNQYSLMCLQYGVNGAKWICLLCIANVFLQASINCKLQAVEELMGRRKELHMAMCKFAREDLGREIETLIAEYKVLLALLNCFLVECILKNIFYVSKIDRPAHLKLQCIKIMASSYSRVWSLVAQSCFLAS